MQTKIRVAQEDDAAAISAIYTPIVRDTAISFEFDPPGSQEMRERIRQTSRTLPWLVCERGDGIAGYAYASPHRTRAAYQWSAEVSVYVSENAHRSGVGRRLYASLLGVLERQGYCNAYAGITMPGDASVRFHEAMGFYPVGVFRRVGFKLGSWHDVGWWQRPLRNDPGTPGAILTFKPAFLSESNRSEPHKGGP